MKKILFVASEAVPFIKTGGLAQKAEHKRVFGSGFRPKAAGPVGLCALPHAPETLSDALQDSLM